MDRHDETASHVLQERMHLLPAVYFNNMCDRELYGWIIFERRGGIPVADPENLSDEFKARANVINIDNLPAGDPTEWDLPPYTWEWEAARLNDVVKEQLDCYNQLEEDGCPPWFNCCQIQHVVYNAKDLPSITDLWRGKYDNGSRVLSKQLLIWKRFRFWQSWRRREENINNLRRISHARLEKLQIGSHLSLFALEPDQSAQNEATTLLEYLDFIDRYYASSRDFLQRCQETLDEACVCEQDFSTKREQHSVKKRKGRAAGTSTGQARVDKCKCKQGAVANLETAKRTLDLRNAIWNRTVNQLHECKPDAVEEMYPLAPLQTEIQTEGAGSAVLQTRPAQDLDVEIVDYRPRKQGARRGRSRGSRSDKGSAYPPGHLRRSPRFFVAKG